MCRPKHVEQLRNTGIINSTTRLHLAGSSYEIYITMHGSMNIKFTSFLWVLMHEVIDSRCEVPSRRVAENSCILGCYAVCSSKCL